ncbi:MAG TPA: DegV family protein [Candidatus Limnocylindrales bacterium]|nr:DegV family protein [Candidatus Limnocylindrales bacterium]
MSFRKIHIVTDSTCDIPPEMLPRLPISVVPTFVNYGGNSYPDDNVQLDREEFYRRLPTIRPFPTTAAMSPGMAEDAIMAAADSSDHVIICTVSTKLSGVYNTMRLAASKLPADKYTLVDSIQVAMGLGWQVIVGAEVAAETGSIEQTLEAMARVRKTVRVYAALGTLEYLHRGGRVGWAQAGIGTLLHIKPIVLVEDGEVKSYVRVRTFSRAIDEVVRVAHEYKPLDRMAIIYGSDINAAYALRDRLQDILPAGDRTLVTRITPSIGVHIGPSGLGIAPLSASWRT